METNSVPAPVLIGLIIGGLFVGSVLGYGIADTITERERASNADAQ